MKLNFALAVFFSLAVLLIAGTPHAAANEEIRTFNVNSGGTLYVDSDAGSIDVESHNSDTVTVEVQRRSVGMDDFKVEMEQDGNDVKIAGERVSRWSGWNTNVRFLVKVPSNYNVDLNTGGGSIDIQDLTGKVDAFTSGGSIELGQIRGDVDVKTSGGSIRVEEVAGNIDANTSGGSIKAVISEQPTKDCRLKTSGGSVTAYLKPSIAVNLNASTSGGRVRSDFTVDGTVKKSKIRGTINGGGPELYLKTSGGSVNIKEI